MRRWIYAAAALVALVLVIAVVEIGLFPRPSSWTQADFRPFVMTIEQWDAARTNYADGRTIGGTSVYRLEYHRRDEWTLILVVDDAGAMAAGHGTACRSGSYGSVDAGGAFQLRSTDAGFCNGVERWVRPGLACCYRWKRDVTDGIVTYTSPGERVVFDLQTGLPLLYEAGPVDGAVGQRTVYRVERWLPE